jgi:hypothetical protein
MNQEDNVIDFMKRVSEGKIQEAEVPDNLEGEFVEYVFDPSPVTNPALRQLFHMFYSAVFGNKIGIMNATNTETGKIETVLVGLERVDDGVATWPIARILTEEEQTKYEFKQGD